MPIIKPIVLIVAFSAWAVPVGVEAELWTIHPVAGWVVFVALVVSWGWIAWSVVTAGFNFAAGGSHRINIYVSRSISGVAAFIVAVFFVFAFELPSLIPPLCAPKLEWRDEVTFGTDPQVPGGKVAIRHVVLTPKVEQPYKMLVSGTEGGLLNLNASWWGMKNGDGMKREDNGIILTLYNPVGLLSLSITPANMGDTDLKIEFECMKNVTR